MESDFNELTSVAQKNELVNHDSHALIYSCVVAWSPSSLLVWSYVFRELILPVTSTLNPLLISISESTFS